MYIIFSNVMNTYIKLKEQLALYINTSHKNNIEDHFR